MTSFSTLLGQGAANAWLFVPSAILLGGLHGLEPGHSKTMMAAFIVAIRGTVAQAVLLGIAATISHTAVVWAIALGGMYFGQKWSAETSEPYLQVASAIVIIGVALWMIWRTWREQRASGHAHDEHDHHHHADAGRLIDTGHGLVRLQVFEDGVPPRFRLFREGAYGDAWAAAEVSIETERADGCRQSFTFRQGDGFLESEQEIPEPHAFIARLRLGHATHSHDYELEFVEHEHAHGHSHAQHCGANAHALSLPESLDAHELAHANDIRRRFANRQATTGQIIVFGLTGGLIPCPASITVLLLCLQLKEITLGATLVLCFSLGLALTMVLSGTLAALSVRHVARSWQGFGEFARKAPYLSGALILLVGLYLGYQGMLALA